MPELPEVETTRRGIEPYLLGQPIEQIQVRHRQLRWPVSQRLQQQARQALIQSVERRAKYLLIRTDHGCLIIHLGMSGSLRITDINSPADKHDHVDLVLVNGTVMRYRDPRRFGAWLWTTKDPLQHERLQRLGPEPLSGAFNAEYMHALAAGRTQTVKTFIMDSHVVVGVGNIYACESLFMAGINPNVRAGRLSLQRWRKLVDAIKTVLDAAIMQGGTTLRDFTRGDGEPGYFAQSLHVYGRADQPCARCGQVIRRIVQTQRSTFYCPRCQRY